MAKKARSILISLTESAKTVSFCRCPTCSSTNLSRPDVNGIVDCFECCGCFSVRKPQIPVFENDEELDDIDDADENDVESDLKRMLGRTPPRIRISYTEITFHDDGEYDDEHGWIDEEGVEMSPDEFDMEEGLTSVDLAVKFLEGKYVNEASSSDFHVGVWYSTTDEDTMHAKSIEHHFHLVDFTPEEEKQIWDRMHDRSQRGSI